MLIRPLREDDISLITEWLQREHVKRWYEIPSMGITIEDWISEIKKFRSEFKWIHYRMVIEDEKPIGFCLYYRCVDSEGEEFGNLSLDGAYGIDYLIGETTYLHKGLGKQMIMQLIDEISTNQNVKLITADIDKENLASRGVLLSCGFILLEGAKNRYIKWIYDENN